eukprot:3302662-Amphidinium_carterae.3
MTHLVAYRGERVGEAKTPGPYVFLEQIPIYTHQAGDQGQKGILTTKWRPQQNHWMCQMSVGPRHTSCHQFSQIIAIQRWMTKHAGDLSAETQADKQTRLERAATTALHAGVLDDTVVDTSAASGSATARALDAHTAPSTPGAEGDNRKVRKRFTSKKSRSLGNLQTPEARGSGQLESSGPSPIAASAACAATPLDGTSSIGRGNAGRRTNRSYSA